MNAIEAEKLSRKSRVSSIGEDLKEIYEYIGRSTASGGNYTSYHVTHRENVELIMHQLREDGYKVRRSMFFHRAENKIEVSW